VWKGFKWCDDKEGGTHAALRLIEVEDVDVLLGNYCSTSEFILFHEWLFDENHKAMVNVASAHHTDPSCVHAQRRLLVHYIAMYNELQMALSLHIAIAGS
jgi:hypothetical protein